MFERRPVATSRWLPVTVPTSGTSSAMPPPSRRTLLRPAADDRDALAGEQVGQDLLDVGVLAGRDPAAGDDGDLGAEPAEHLPELSPM